MSVASILNKNGLINSNWIDGSTSSGVQSISSGDGIIVEGGNTANPTIIARNQLENISEGEGIRVQQLSLSTIISNDGVLGITAGSSNVTIDSSNRGYPSISVSTTGMDISAGLGIDISGTQTNPIITNNGIIEITAGEGINVVFPLINPDARFPTIVNRGIITMVDGTGINIDYTSDPHRPTVNSTAVLALTAGKFITIDGSNNNLTIDAVVPEAVTSVTAGDGINVDNTDPLNPIVSNTGVLALTAGTNITINGSNSNLTINNPVYLGQWYKASSQTAGSGTTNVTFSNATSWSDLSGYIGLTNSSTFTTIKKGIYQLDFVISNAPNTASWQTNDCARIIAISITRGGNSSYLFPLSQWIHNSPATNQYGTVSATTELDVGDVIRLQLVQTLQSGLTSIGGVSATIPTDYNTSFTWRFIKEY